MLPVVAQLTIAAQTIYTVAAPASRAVIRMIRVANNSAASRTFNLYVVVGGVQRQFSGKDQSIDIGQIALDTDEFQLSIGDSLVATCSADSTVDVFISGDELDRSGKVVLP